MRRSADLLDNRAVFMFAGPTLARARRIATAPSLPSVTVLPPAARGDIEKLVRRHAPATIVLVDGVLHEQLAVGHIELRDAIGAGWDLWGIASMGAIRAREMQHMGLKGYGEVFSQFNVEGRDVRDDEVVLLHGPGPEYVELSEPLVHLRAALDSFTRRGLLSTADADAIACELSSAYFGDRTLAWFAQLVRSRALTPFDPLADIDDHRTKCHDLIRFEGLMLASPST